MRKSRKMMNMTSKTSSLSLFLLACLAASTVSATPSSSGQSSGSGSGSSGPSSSKRSNLARGFDGARESFLETVLEANVSNQKSCKPTGLIQDACCDYQTVEDVNEDMASRLKDIIKLPFFRYQKVDLFRECPFWQEDGSCMNRACAVEETEEASIPEAWRSGALGQVKEALGYPKTLEGALFRDEDFCVLDEASTSSDGVYVDLYENPERFTGYAGASANKVWKAIYEENCFDIIPFLNPPTRSSLENGGTGYIKSGLLTSGKDKSVRGLMGNLGLAAPKDPQDDEQCLEKRVYYRLISGLHASISIHICSEYLDQSTGEWRPNLECFITRIAEHPERLQNVYFDYVLMLRALRKVAPYLRNYNYDTGDTTIDAETHTLVNGLLDRAESCSATFDETSMFNGGIEAQALKEEFKNHFRNVSRIMDCVGCDKCRLWGKTQVTGVATGLKILFSLDDDNALLEPSSATSSSSSPSSNEHQTREPFSLRRSEIVSFIWTLNRFSESLAAVEEFRQMWAKRNFSIEAVKDEQETKKMSQVPTTADEEKQQQNPETSQKLKEENEVELGVGGRGGENSGPSMTAQDGVQGPVALPPMEEPIAGYTVFEDDEQAAASPAASPRVEEPDSQTQPHTQKNSSDSSYVTPTAMSTALGPILHGIFEKFIDACRSSIVACLALVERGVAFLAGSLGSEKSEL